MPVQAICETCGVSENEAREVINKLIRNDKVSIVFGDIHPNPHIKAFKEEAQEKQIEKLERNELGHACIYPTPSHLRVVVNPADYAGKPFTLKLALGEPWLSYYSFDLSVLEFYHSDPRYTYRNNDISGMICYQNEDMKESDQVLLESFGFSFGPNMERAVVVFLTYLSRLSPEHQQIWNAKMIQSDYALHPDYYRSAILGEWPERVSVFDAFVEELHHINEMCRLIGKAPLFKKEYREDKKPKDFCFMMRPTSKRYYGFVELLDKMLSQNFNYEFFSDEVSTETERRRKDGEIVVQKKGTLQLLDEYLKLRFITDDRKDIEDMIRAFKNIRQLRRDSAHEVQEDVYDPKYYDMQRDLIINAYEGIRLIRLMFANHPLLRDYKVPDWLFYGKLWNY